MILSTYSLFNFFFLISIFLESRQKYASITFPFHGEIQKFRDRISKKQTNKSTSLF